MATPTATVDPTSVKVPILTAGDISPTVMMDFENAAQDFFVTKSVPAEKQVVIVIPGVKDICIRDWITADHEHLIALLFIEFMKELQSNYLHQDWEDQVHNNILTSTLANAKMTFWNRAQHLLKLNCLLRRTLSVFNDTVLRNHLKAHLDDDLKACVHHSDACKDKTFKAWVATVCLIDEAHTIETKCQRDLIEETLQRQPKCQNTDGLCGPSRHANTSQTSTSASLSSTSLWLPSLTNDKCTLLNEHEGCTKCRRFYAGHHSQSCLNGFPTGKGYKPLVLTDTLAAKKAKAVAKTLTKAVAATIEDVDSDEEFMTAAAVMPNSPGIYESNSEDYSDISGHDVSCPLCSKHLLWDCQIHGLISDFPVMTRALIDNGAHLVLIHPELVDQLGLKKYHLHKPETIDVVFGNKKKQGTKLYNYVKLSITLLDSQWTSRTVRALVTLGLCAPIILGLPWLVHNSIVIDHAARTCIDKKNAYDLLNPPKIVPPPACKLRLHEQIKETKADKKLVLAELMLVCNDRLKNSKFKPEIVEPFDVVAAVRGCIESLAAADALIRHEQKLKSEFKPIFEPIPHVDDLPWDVITEIHIKNAEKTIKTCTYPSLWKYKEAWQILIQQHLDAGCIQPLPSPCASPSFIIPKSNPNVLPCWVNNYRQLNENTIMDSHPLPRIDDILNDCAKGKVWATIDMTNSFFQTRMHPGHVHLTVVTTPLGLYEWLVMPMGLKNAPAIHQQCVTAAL